MTRHWFIRKLLADQYREQTARQYASYLDVFQEIVPKDVRDVTGEDIIHFLHRLRSYPHRSTGSSKAGYSDRTIEMMCGGIKRYFRYLLLEGSILRTPFDGLDVHILQSRRMRDALPVATIQRFLDSISGNDASSVRDRGIFEMLYGTGMRVGELCALKMVDMDMNGRRAYIARSKNGRDRYVPLGNELVRSLSRYEQAWHEIRRDDSFFCNDHGKKLSRGVVNFYLTKRLTDAGMDDVKLSPHIFRHSFATHMLHGGAHIRHVQEILGHESLESTVVYTHFDVPSKRKLMKMYHPLENELSDILEKSI